METESEAPPSRPGFESDAEKSAETFQIPFPDVNVSFPFPVTLIQDQILRDTERYAANITSTGLSPRVNNIVRAFNIHGPLDRELLKQALDKIANFHPLLLATFLRSKGQIYAQTPSPGTVNSGWVFLGTYTRVLETDSKRVCERRLKVSPSDPSRRF